MSANLTLPACFLPIASHYYERKNPYRSKVETGGYLLADPANPDAILLATGPGDGSEHTREGLTFGRDDVAAAAQAAGLALVGDWHTHPEGSASAASPTDYEAWRAELTAAPQLGTWASVILVRDHENNRWSDMAAWRTVRRNGICIHDRVETLPGLQRARELGSQLSWQVGRSALVEPWTWKADPGRLRLELAALDVAVEASDNLHRQDLNARLERLGFPGRLKPLSPLPAKPAPASRRLLVRHGIGKVLDVR